MPVLMDISVTTWRRLHPRVDRVRRGEDVAEFVVGDDADARHRRALQFEADACEAERLGKPRLAAQARAAAARLRAARRGPIDGTKGLRKFERRVS